MVCQQTQRWLNAGCLEAMVSDLRPVIRGAQARQGQPSAVIPDGRALQSTCESGPRAGCDGHPQRGLPTRRKRKRDSKVHMAVDTPGLLLAVHVTPANGQERAQVAELARQVQQATGQTVKLAFANQGYTGETGAQAGHDEGIALQIVNCPRQRRALCCCHAAGWSNAASAGSPVSGGWRGTTSVCPKPWQVCTSLSSQCSCLYMSHRLPRVPRTLQADTGKPTLKVTIGPRPKTVRWNPTWASG